MKRISIAIFTAIAVFSTKAFSQEVASASGNVFQNAEGSVSFTVGELTVETLSAENSVLTQGFHQPALTIVPVNNPETGTIQALVFPNPASDKIQLNVYDENFSGMEYFLNNSSGIVLLNGTIESENTIVSFEGLSPAIYFLVVKKNGKEVKTFKIVKE